MCRSTKRTPSSPTTINWRTLKIIPSSSMILLSIHPYLKIVELFSEDSWIQLLKSWRRDSNFIFIEEKLFLLSESWMDFNLSIVNTFMSKREPLIKKNSLIFWISLKLKLFNYPPSMEDQNRLKKSYKFLTPISKPG